MLEEQFRQNEHNIMKYSVFVDSSSSLQNYFFFCLPAAECKLNTGHAGVLLVERRGSYPLIDLQILKSRSLLGFSHACRVRSGVFSSCRWNPLCNSRQPPAGGGSVQHQAKGQAAAELPEVRPRFQAAPGAGAARPAVAAPAG